MAKQTAASAAAKQTAASAAGAVGAASTAGVMIRTWAKGAGRYVVMAIGVVIIAFVLMIGFGLAVGTSARESMPVVVTGPDPTTIDGAWVGRRVALREWHDARTTYVKDPSTGNITGAKTWDDGTTAVLQDTSRGKSWAIK